jgi:acyl-CoA-binding protein
MLHHVRPEIQKIKFEVWESLTAKEAMAVRNEYIKLGLQTRSGKMPDNALIG